MDGDKVYRRRLRFVDLLQRTAEPANQMHNLQVESIFILAFVNSSV